MNWGTYSGFIFTSDTSAGIALVMIIKTVFLPIPSTLELNCSRLKRSVKLKKLISILVIEIDQKEIDAHHYDETFLMMRG
jgi:hypothetical protein